MSKENVKSAGTFEDPKPVPGGEVDLSVLPTGYPDDFDIGDGVTWKSIQDRLAKKAKRPSESTD